MKAFLKRWHAEFKKDREIRQNTLLPTISIEAYGAAFQNNNPLSFLNVHDDLIESENAKGYRCDAAGNPNLNGHYW